MLMTQNDLVKENIFSRLYVESNRDGVNTIGQRNAI